MSKQIEVGLACPQCQKRFKATLFSTLWIDNPELRELVFSNRLNAVQCPGCQVVIGIDASVYIVNQEMNFAVWYEPEPDEQVDLFAEGMARTMGENSFQATAPRISDWEEVKATIEKYERGELVGQAPSKLDFSGMDWAVKKELEMKREQSAKRPGLLSRLFGRKG